MGAVVDICKVQFAVEDFEAVAGLPESVFATEGLPSSTTCCSPASCSACCPRCSWCPSYGKIEPLLGMSPRTEKTWIGGISFKVVLACLVGFVAAVATQLIAESGFSIVDWEADWAGSGTALAIGLVVAAALAVVVLAVLKWKAGKDGTTTE